MDDIMADSLAKHTAVTNAGAEALHVLLKLTIDIN